MKDYAVAKIQGCVVRTHANYQGTFGALTVETSRDGRRTLHEMKCFDQEVNKMILDLGQGEVVTVTCELGSESLKAKDKSDVMVDGYKKWVPSLKITKIERVTGAIGAPPPKKAAPPKQSAPNYDDEMPDWK